MKVWLKRQIGRLARFATAAQAAGRSSRAEESLPSKVAVVVPVFNGGADLTDCLESVARQSWKGWRCYVVDDGSSDGTSGIAEAFAVRDRRFTVLRHGCHAGLAAARNTGLVHAEEPLVVFLDGDDVLTPCSLRRRVEVMRQWWGDEAVAGAWEAAPGVGQDAFPADAVGFDKDSPGLAAGYAPLCRATLLRRSGGFDEQLQHDSEEQGLWQRLLRHGYRFERAGAGASAATQLPPQKEGAAAVDCRPLPICPDVAVVAETGADVHGLAGFARRLRGCGWDAVAIDADYAGGDQGATRAWRRADMPLVPYNHLLLGRARPARLLLCRPFGPATARLAAEVAGAGGAVVEWDGGVGEARLPCNATEAIACHGSWSADMEVPDKASGTVLEPAWSAPAPQWAKPPAVQVRHARDLAREEGSLDPVSTALLESLRDKHRGETVVVIGNGPSLNASDLNLLAGVATMGVNGIFYARERLPEALTYYVVEDTKVFAENVTAIKAFECRYKLFPTLYRDAFSDNEIDRARMGFFRMNMGFYNNITGTLCMPRFSTDAVQRLYCGQSVTIINLQFAYWMGFSRVVLIGMDFSYRIPKNSVRKGVHILSKGDDPNHFHPDYFGKGKTWKDPKLERVLANYALAREMFAADGREIVNASEGGKLELFRRMPLAEAVGRKAKRYG